MIVFCTIRITSNTTSRIMERNCYWRVIIRIITTKTCMSMWRIFRPRYSLISFWINTTRSIVLPVWHITYSPTFEYVRIIRINCIRSILATTSVDINLHDYWIICPISPTISLTYDIWIINCGIIISDIGIIFSTFTSITSILFFIRIVTS